LAQNFDVIRPSNHAFVSAARVLLGLFVLVTGVMTMFVPEFRATFLTQLAAAGIPLVRASLFLIPAIELVAGAMLLGGFMIRLASLAVVLLMALMTYLHLIVDEPVLFPLQLGIPLIPIVALVLSGFLYVVDTYFDDA
jgi:uncharacterized membrane protein YphA (DoxX/SURF4 family)